MELHLVPCGHVGNRGIVVQEQHQRGALPQRMRNFSSSNDLQRFVKEYLGEYWTVDRRRTGHDAIPFAKSESGSKSGIAWYPGSRNRTTLQGFVKGST